MNWMCGVAIAALVFVAIWHFYEKSRWKAQEEKLRSMLRTKL